MKTNTIRTRTHKAIAGAALAVVMSTPDLAHATDQLAWDKTFPQSEKVIHQMVSFNNRLGINLVADLYLPKISTVRKSILRLSSAVPMAR
jgi:hypothetical protein